MQSYRRSGIRTDTQSDLLCDYAHNILMNLIWPPFAHSSHIPKLWEGKLEVQLYEYGYPVSSIFLMDPYRECWQVVLAQ